MMRILLLAVGLAFLLAYPHLVPNFWAYQIGAQTLILGIITLSLTLLAGFAGFVSFAQLSVAGVAGYAVAYFGPSATSIGMQLGWLVAVVLGLFAGMIAATLIGIIALRTSGIYMIMITLAIAVVLFYFARQNYTFMNGYTGFSGIRAPVIAGVDLQAPVAFYYLCLACAAGAYCGVRHVVRTPFGLAVQGVRDNPVKLAALGYSVIWTRIAIFALAGLIAALGGILSLWYGGRISPGTIGIGPVVNILIIAVIGGIASPIGAFVGALVFTLLDNFAIDFVDRERFNTLIGICFVAIVLFSPDGLTGIARRLWGHGARVQHETDLLNQEEKTT